MAPHAAATTEKTVASATTRMLKLGASGGALPPKLRPPRPLPIDADCDCEGLDDCDAVADGERDSAFVRVCVRECDRDRVWLSDREGVGPGDAEIELVSDVDTEGLNDGLTIPHTTPVLSFVPPAPPMRIWPDAPTPTEPPKDELGLLEPGSTGHCVSHTPLEHSWTKMAPAPAPEGAGDGVGVIDAVHDAEGEEEAVAVSEADALAVPDWLCVTVMDGLRVGDALDATDDVGVGVAACEGDPDALGVERGLGEPVALALPACEGLPETEAVAEPLGDDESDADAPCDGVAEGLPVPLRVPLGVTLGVAAGLRVPEPEPEGPWVCEPVCVPVCDGVRVCDGV